MVCKNLSRKTLSQNNGLVEWLKVKALSSSPRTAKKKKGAPVPPSLSPSFWVPEPSAFSLEIPFPGICGLSEEELGVQIGKQLLCDGRLTWSG
jgi:hypothetical protein